MSKPVWQNFHMVGQISIKESIIMKDTHSYSYAAFSSIRFSMDVIFGIGAIISIAAFFVFLLIIYSQCLNC